MSLDTTRPAGQQVLHWPDPNEELWSLEQTADYLGIHRKTLAKQAREGTIEAIQPGARVWKFRASYIRSLGTRPTAKDRPITQAQLATLADALIQIGQLGRALKDSLKGR